MIATTTAMGKFHALPTHEMTAVSRNGTLFALNNESSDIYVPDQAVLSLGGKILYASIICPMIAICALGNTLTIVSYFRDIKLQTVQNVYLVNLAVADFSIGLISMPFYFVTTMLDYQWIFGRLFCKIWNSFDFVMCLVSAYALVLVSVDRSLMVWQGAAYSVHQTKRGALLRISISWCFAILIYVPAIMFWDVWVGYSVTSEGICELEFYKNVPYTLTTAILEFVVPFSSITVLSVYLYVTIIKKSRLALNTRIWSNTSAKSQASFHTICKELDKNQEIQVVEQAQNGDDGSIKSKVSSLRQKITGKRSNEPDEIERRILHRNQRAARRLAVLVAVFVICWTPYTVATIVIAVCDGCFNDHLYEALIWLQWANSAINPFLYAMTTPRFKQNYVQILRLGRRKSRRKKKKEIPPAARTSVSSC